ncbi:MAG: helicase-related protein, partial [Bacteroidia bacterium]|nr:helicase-related protein [Bacteroidia bacterium]
MPTIYDNDQNKLHEELARELREAYAADFCVGYFRLSGWKLIAEAIDGFKGGKNGQCRLLIGMPFSEAYIEEYRQPSRQEVYKTKQALKNRLQRQLETEKQSFESQKTLCKLYDQLREQKVAVKIYTPQPLHAKLYLLYRKETKAKIVAYLGSSNLTFAGLKMQNELNVDVLEQDAAQKLQTWFEERWNNLFSLDVTQDLVEIIRASWAFAQQPFMVYMQTVYHLCADFREGGTYDLPEVFRQKLLDFQHDAFKRAVVEMERGKPGVMIGDVVGLGKTMTACAIAKHFEAVHDAQVVVFCPPNLVKMWNAYSAEYQLKAKVLSHALSEKEYEEKELDKTGDFIIIDESHNLRNIRGKRYKRISGYLQKRRNANPDARVLLLTATPYNKDFSDLYAQLAFIIDPEAALPVKPEAEIKACGGETEFKRKHKFEGRINSLAAFAKSDRREDWRNLMQQFFIRRTRSFVKSLCPRDERTGKPFLTLDGKKHFFPERIPKNLPYDHDPSYAELFCEQSVEAIAGLRLPRYALGLYLKEDLLDESRLKKLHESQRELIADLKRPKSRLRGFCKTNFFKRLESCGESFRLSLERHLLRNRVFLYAIENGKDLHIGAVELDVEEYELDNDAESYALEGVEEQTQRAEAVYAELRKNQKRYRWAPVEWFSPTLKEHLEDDCRVIAQMLEKARRWNPKTDSQLLALHRLATQIHPDQKILVFSQFADTVRYLAKNLVEMGVENVRHVTGDTENLYEIIRNFSPKSNRHVPEPGAEIRVLISSDVLSEGHNLQDCHIVVNYDLPWTIVPLTQRAGRVDRIGQSSENVYCYSVVPQEGLERLIRLRSRLLNRLGENDEVVGSDEVFFENQKVQDEFRDLYAEKPNVIEDQETDETDVYSEAYKIWVEHSKNDPKLEDKIKNMPLRSMSAIPGAPKGVIVYLRTESVNGLKMLDCNGAPLALSASALLKKMECRPGDPPSTPHENHHELVEAAVYDPETYAGNPGGIKGTVAWRVYEKLKRFADPSLFDNQDSKKQQEALALDAVYRKPLDPQAKKILGRLVNLKTPEETLMKKVVDLYQSNRLTIDDEQTGEIEVVCS